MALIGMAFGLGFTFGPLVATWRSVGTRRPGTVAGLCGGDPVSLCGPAGDFQAARIETRTQRLAARRIGDWRSFSDALATPSIGLLLAAVFVCIFSFAAYETTLSMLVKGSDAAAQMPFHFSFRQVCLTYAYIGFMLALVQGGVVRRLADG